MHDKCLAPNCTNLQLAKGYCSKHYQQIRKHGDLTPDTEQEVWFGNKNHELYGTWLNMKNRCANSSDLNFKYYGARGVSVCDRWRRSFQAFAADVGDRPTDKHTLDRIDTYGDYTPGNTRWVTRSDQALNCRKRASKTGERHVYESSKTNRYVVQICRNYTIKYLGTYDTIDEAVEARDAALTSRK